VAVALTGPLRMTVIAAPGYLEAHGVPKTPRDLRSHRCINLRMASAGTLYKWEFERGAEKVDVAVEGPLVFDDGDMVVDAVLAGVGLGFVMEDRASSFINSGALTQVLADWCAPFPGFHLYYPGRGQLSPALAAFIEAIRFRPTARKAR
jgi:DNA-binding transcriptional LysR family regulator